MQKSNELQARLAEVSPEDLDAALALHLEITKSSNQVGSESPDYLRWKELSRRSERLMGQAVKLGQARGQIMTRTNTRKGLQRVEEFFPNKGQGSRAYGWGSVSDEEFEAAIKQTYEMAGGPTVRNLRQVLGLGPKVAQVDPTVRGTKTVKHMAIQLNAIALGVQGVEPGEVGADQVDMVNQALADIGVIRGWLKRVSGNVQAG